MASATGREGEREHLKRQAAERAAALIEDGMVLGLGTGSTVAYLLDYIATRRNSGDWTSIVAIPTSQATYKRARELGLPLTTLEHHPAIDLTIDGADEVDERLSLIKGLGGALLREKIVASLSERLAIIVDDSKLVRTLGTRAPLPIEVDPFGASAQLPFLRSLGADPELRRDQADAPMRTDGGHYIVDCHFPQGIDRPEELDAALMSRPGVLETGLFLGMTDLVIVAGNFEIREILAPQG